MLNLITLLVFLFQFLIYTADGFHCQSIGELCPCLFIQINASLCESYFALDPEVAFDVKQLNINFTYVCLHSATPPPIQNNRSNQCQSPSHFWQFRNSGKTFYMSHKEDMPVEKCMYGHPVY